jgi:hypothetical protein
MEPITLIVTALAAGASAGLMSAVKDDAKSAVAAVYARLRDGVRKLFAGDQSAEMVLDEHEKAPEIYAAPLTQKLTEFGADGQEDLVALAQELMTRIDQEGARAGKYNVKVTGGMGVQVGDGSTQTNYFSAPSA